jgi:hypothetical protein
VITAAALLVLVALGLFVWGIVTGATALYWACVAVSAVAAVLLVIAFLRMRAAVAPENAAPSGRAEPDERSAADREAAAPAGQPATSEGDPGHEADYDGSLPGSAGQRRRGDASTGPASPPSSAHAAAPGAEAAAAPPAVPPAAVPPAGSPTEHTAPPAADGAGDPPVEEVEVTDLLLVVDLHDDVLVVDEHPRYHLAGCSWLAGRTTIPLPVDEARTDGFTPCGTCAPDHGLAELERGRRTARGSA